MRFQYLLMPTGRKPWASRWPWERWYSPGTSKKLWTRLKAIFDTPVSHWSRSRPMFEIAEAALAEAIFIGLQLPPDCHTPRWECGNSRRPVQVSTLCECQAMNETEVYDAKPDTKCMAAVDGAWAGVWSD